MIALTLGNALFPGRVHAEPVIFVSPLVDLNDRIDAILAAVDPPLSVQRIGVDRRGKPGLWGRANGEEDPADSPTRSWW